MERFFICTKSVFRFRTSMHRYFLSMIKSFFILKIYELIIDSLVLSVAI